MEGSCEGLKRSFFRTIRKVPFIKRKIDEEIAKIDKNLTEDMYALFKGKNDTCHYITQLPCTGLSSDDIVQKLSEYMELGHYKWEEGSVSGTVYHGGKDLTELNTRVYNLTAWTNPLHHEVFPGVCKMEAEIVRVVAGLFHGGPETCGTVTSGGTESIILAVKAYRDFAKHQKGITNPEILVPVTAHAAFVKAAQLLGIRIKHVPILKDSCIANVKAMRKLITKNTIMLVGSTPSYPHGCIDNIEGIASLGRKYNIPVHVDACLGGFLIAFMPEAGFPVSPFDFEVNGVTSISADTHKYGFSPKGSSVLLFSDIKYKHHQYFTIPSWPGGLYASPTMAGSRSGVIAGCWSSLLYFGMSGYIESTQKIVSTTRSMEQKLRQIKGIHVMGNPQVSVVAIASNEFDIYRLGDDLAKKGWSLNPIQFPPGIHICLTHCHTKPGVAERFVSDVENAVNCIMKDPTSPALGVAAIYGTSQQIQDRSLVNEITAIYLDKLYMTDFPIGNDEPNDSIITSADETIKSK